MQARFIEIHQVFAKITKVGYFSNIGILFTELSRASTVWNIPVRAAMDFGRKALC